MKMTHMLAGLLFLSGCAHSSWETGSRDPDMPPESFRMNGTQPASLFEMTFGGGESEVTKNLPKDAAHSVGDAIKQHRGKQPADVTAATED